MAHLLIATPSHSLHGGVERIIESLARGLPAHGFRVTVGLAKGARWHQPERFRREYPGLDTVELDGTSGTRAGRLRGLKKALDWTRPDIVLIARLFDAYEAVSELKMLGDPVRLAVTIQAYEADYIWDLATYGAFVDGCVTSGKLIAASVRHHTPLSAESIVNIPGGVRSPLHVTQREPSLPIRLGYVGRLDLRQKRVLDLPRVLAGLRDLQVAFTCRIAGAGDAEPQLRDALAEHRLSAQVSFDGWKTLEELYGVVYPSLDVLLHFAEWEGITIAPREAMAHGVVPVISRFLGLRTEGHFRHGENSLTFRVGEIREAIAHVKRLSEDIELWRQLSARARQSEGGVWSEVGALKAWAASLARCLERPSARSNTLPKLSFAPSGRLARWFGEGAADRLRILRGRRSTAHEPGSEWPQVSGLADPHDLREIDEFAHRMDAMQALDVSLTQP